MSKIFLVLTISLISIGSFAQSSLRCSCEREFEDFIGNVSHVTVHVSCPNFNDKSELSCDSEIQKKTFSAACTNMVTEEQNVTTIALDPMDNPVYGYTYCHLN